MIGESRASRSGQRYVGPLALGLVMLLFAGCAGVRSACADDCPGPGSARPLPVRSVLPNGVVLIVQEHRASDVVALQLWMRVGGRDESPDELGLSHYLEHMLFKGTPTRPPGSIDLLIEGLGGQSNAFTSYDYTHYDVVIPSGHVKAGVELLADIAVNAAFPPAEIDRERAVVLEEMRLLEDNPEQFLLRRLTELAYAPHPYGRALLGDRELIRGLSRDKLARYYKKYYEPRSMVLIVVGAIAPAEIRRMAEGALGGLPPTPDARPSLGPSPPPAGIRRIDVARSEKQAYLGLAWLAAPTGSPDIYAVDLLTYILGDGPSSRLNQVVREQEQLVSTIEAGYGARQLGGLVTVTARLDTANLDRAERAILDVIRRVQETGVTEAERQRALITAEANYAFDIETAEGLAKSYGEAETMWTLENELQYLERLRQTTSAQIQDVARRYFGEDRYARVRLAPSSVLR